MIISKIKKNLKFITYFDNKIIYLNYTIKNWHKKLLKKYFFQININSYSLFEKLLIKNKIKCTKLFIRKYYLIGNGLKCYYYKNNIILDFNQNHWYLIKTQINKINIRTIKENLYFYSKDNNLINHITNKIIKLKKFNYYKSKGFINFKNKKIFLKKN
jgi:hypothetical protein